MRLHKIWPGNVISYWCAQSKHERDTVFNCLCSLFSLHIGAVSRLHEEGLWFRNTMCLLEVLDFVALMICCLDLPGKVFCFALNWSGVKNAQRDSQEMFPLGLGWEMGSNSKISKVALSAKAPWRAMFLSIWQGSIGSIFCKCDAAYAAMLYFNNFKTTRAMSPLRWHHIQANPMPSIAQVCSRLGFETGRDLERAPPSLENSIHKEQT